jgi:F-type H+-transporting ATPase subunit delta
VSEKRTIARPYARALFADAQGKDAQTLEALASLLDILAMSVKVSDMDQAIKNPNVQSEQVIEILAGICEDADATSVKTFGKDHLNEWLVLLSSANRLGYLPEMAELFSDECAKNQGAIDVIVSSAEPLSAAQKDLIIKQLSAKWNKTVQADYQNDPTLLGGVRIQAGDWVLDRSIADKLLRLSEDIQS